MAHLPEFVQLEEQSFCPATLAREDAAYLGRLGFFLKFESTAPAEEPDSGIDCEINPGPVVGHFQLPSRRIVVIRPKVSTASVFRMLAYVFTDSHRRWLRDDAVLYASDKLIFEPLVELFNSLVAARARRGLVQDYIRREENLGSFRGALNVHQHLQQNLGRDNRIHCRFFEQTVDVPDNRLVKAALHQLLQFGGWTSRTTHALIRNFHQFDSVTLERLPSARSSVNHYHRLNDDYRPIHELCRMFMAQTSVSERVGTFGFRGFLLDMNRLFEDFIQKAFQTAMRPSRLGVHVQESRRLSSHPVAPLLRPDITIRLGDEIVVVADAKYKKDKDAPPNSDMYQVITYGTVLECRDVFLLYPATEVDSEYDMPIINSGVVVKTRRVDISSKKAVENTEELARDIVSQCTRTVSECGFKKVI